ncbi:MAG TPA: class I adenylate-forming enzyme family protein [Acidimicrobiales bacterium]|jgi:acyl-CoA synthetase|nr:class I adenylate-forming enzyme family protein [Acidimicrobiales bacterium]
MANPLPTADPADVAAYVDAGWWGTDTLTDVIRRHAADQPHATAFVDEHGDRMSWRTYDTVSDRIAGALIGTGLERGTCVVVFMPDGPLVHAAFVGVEKAGLVIMGIGHRAGEAELDHLVGKSGAQAIVTLPTHRGEAAGALVERLRQKHPGLVHHVVVAGPSTRAAVAVVGSTSAAPRNAELQRLIDARRVGPNELFLLNSTSGTTGLPKCVVQFENRWFYFHKKAQDFGELSGDDVFMSVVPAPFGFGLWTAHFTPTILGAPCVVMEQFKPEVMIELIEREKVSVLSCVSTQFIMMLNSPLLESHDVNSLRVMFTGGEAIPEARAREFEGRTGSMVMNFYGSNETGMLSGTRLTDPPNKRLTTTGRVIDEMQVRLYTPEGERIAGDVGRGVPACKGPATTIGYYEDDEANKKLFASDGWMLMGDVVEIDDEGWLAVVGRTSDFIIRGGKNISAPAVEDEVASHPSVSMVAVVPAPDPVFGERVAAFVELHPGASLDLDDLRAHLSARGVSKEWYPEYLFVVDALPRASGGKVAKGELKKDAATRVTQ